MIWAIAVLIILAGCAGFFLVLKSRNMHIWFVSWLKQVFTQFNKAKKSGDTVHVYFCLADHYEPFWGKVGRDKAVDRVKAWVEHYPPIALAHKDSDGNSPKHSFFYPEEEYDPEILDMVKEICDQGVGDVEIHLHHDDDSAGNMHRTLENFKTVLHRSHGFLHGDEDKLEYAFIHGNWALDNSRPDGRWCGVDNELSVLVETGCYMDMTLPSAPSDTQTRIINSIYMARGQEGKCKSHDSGRLLQRGDWVKPGELLMVQGPLTLNWKSRKFGIMPRLETSEISADAPPGRHRVELWESCNISVKGHENHIFIKCHTHGAEDSAIRMFFYDNGFDQLWNHLEAQFRDREGYALHYVTAREMYEQIKTLATGEGKEKGSPA